MLSIFNPAKVKFLKVIVSPSESVAAICLVLSPSFESSLNPVIVWLLIVGFTLLVTVTVKVSLVVVPKALEAVTEALIVSPPSFEPDILEDKVTYPELLIANFPDGLTAHVTDCPLVTVNLAAVPAIPLAAVVTLAPFNADSIM